jgi:F-type H+-transporting ATPase subunit b
MLQLDAQQILSQALSFLLLLWVLRRWAWRPLLGVLDARRAHIEGQLQQAEQSRKDMERLHQEYTQRLATIDAEARGKIQQAILEGRRIAGEIQEEARSQAQAIIAKSKQTVELELDKAKVTLRDQLADMAIDAVERIVRKTLDAQTDRRLVDAILEELEHRDVSV